MKERLMSAIRTVGKVLSHVYATSAPDSARPASPQCNNGSSSSNNNSSNNSSNSRRLTSYGKVHILLRLWTLSRRQRADLTLPNRCVPRHVLCLESRLEKTESVANTCVTDGQIALLRRLHPCPALKMKRIAHHRHHHQTRAWTTWAHPNRTLPPPSRPAHKVASYHGDTPGPSPPSNLKNICTAEEVASRGLRSASPRPQVPDNGDSNVQEALSGLDALLGRVQELRSAVASKQGKSKRFCNLLNKSIREAGLCLEPSLALMGGGKWVPTTASMARIQKKFVCYCVHITRTSASYNSAQLSIYIRRSFGAEPPTWENPPSELLSLSSACALRAPRHLSAPLSS